MRKLVAIAILAVSCTSKISDDHLNTEAIALHNSMVKKAAMIRDRLNELQNDSLVNQDSVSHLVQLLEQWAAGLIEVPGNEHHDHTHHAHNHEHVAPPVTAEQMLAIQKELDTRLSMIGKRTTQLKPHDNHEHQH